MVKQDFNEILKIHGYICSDEESDSELKTNLDEIFENNKPPPTKIDKRYTIIDIPAKINSEPNLVLNRNTTISQNASKISKSQRKRLRKQLWKENNTNTNVTISDRLENVNSGSLHTNEDCDLEKNLFKNQKSNKKKFMDKENIVSDKKIKNICTNNKFDIFLDLEFRNEKIGFNSQTAEENQTKNSYKASPVKFHLGISQDLNLKKEGIYSDKQTNKVKVDLRHYSEILRGSNPDLNKTQTSGELSKSQKKRQRKKLCIENKNKVIYNTETDKNDKIAWMSDANPFNEIDTNKENTVNQNPSKDFVVKLTKSQKRRLRQQSETQNLEKIKTQKIMKNNNYKPAKETNVKTKNKFNKNHFSSTEFYDVRQPIPLWEYIKPKLV